MLLRWKCFWVSLLKSECPHLRETRKIGHSAQLHSTAPPDQWLSTGPAIAFLFPLPHTFCVRSTLEIDNLAWELYCAFKCKLLGNWQLLCLNCNDWSTSVLGFFFEYILTGIYVLLHSSQAQIYARVLKLSSVNPWAVTILLGNPFLWPIQQL